MVYRISFFIILLFSILFLPIWASAIVAIMGMLYINVFFEAVVLFLVSDSLYATAESKFLGTYFTSFIVSIAVLLLVEWSKGKLKFYS